MDDKTSGSPADGAGRPGGAASGGPGALPGGTMPPVAQVERRGIEHVSAGDRWGRPRNLFWMWAGATWNVEFVVYGGLAVAVFRLSFAQAVAMIIVGNLFYVLTGLASLQGPRAGTTTFTVSRAPFGPHGNRMPSFFNWLTQVGFEIEGIALIVLAGVALAAKGGVTAGTSVKIVFIIVAVAIQAVLPLLGHAAVLKVLRWLTVPFVILFVVMAALTAPKVNLHANVAHGANWGAMLVVLALVISAGGLGWTENANDYSRYLPATTPKRRIVPAVAFGGGISSVLMEVLGAAVATGVPAATSITGLPAAFPGWFVIPYLIFAIAQLFAINTIDLYSSGVTLQSLVPKLSRLQCVGIDSVVAGALAGYAVFSARFTSLLADFLLFIIVWLGPWCAIFLIDCWLRRNRYDHGSLLDERAGRYFRRGGIHWPAVIAQVVGMVAAAVWLNAYSPYVSPLSSMLGGSDLSVFMGLVFGGGVYWVLAHRSVRAEAEAVPAPLAGGQGAGVTS